MKPFRAVAYTVHKLRFTPLEHGTLFFSLKSFLAPGVTYSEGIEGFTTPMVRK
jgi:hypothetical protein